MSAMSPDEIRLRVAELGDWFHNLDLDGVQTAPDHFLQDYPRSKFRRFAHALPEDLSGRSVLDIGCNGGFYAMEMKRRGADRVLGIDSDDRYLAQARLAAEVRGARHRVSQAVRLRRRSLGERFDWCSSWGCSTTCATRCWPST
jgi:tRNA (mo5U34)-methyltransferase